MKQTFRLFSLLAAVALTLVACNPDPVEPTDVERNIVYTVDQTTTTVHLNTEAEFDALLEQFCDYAEGGSTVTFYNANRAVKGSTKETVTYSTTNREEMKRWMAQMEDEGRTVTISYDSSTGTYNGMAYTPGPQPQSDWVDLGLPSGLLWAKCNLGANAPEEYGNYYAWGEISPKEVYNWNTYRYGTADGEGNLLTLTKYNTHSDYGTPDSLTILRATDDAATMAFGIGSGARTPTKEEWQELIDYSTVEWTTMNGVNGLKFTSITNGNTLFFPAAGMRYGSELHGVDGCGFGFYWSSSLDTNSPSDAWAFCFDANNPVHVGKSNRRYGFTVRAVRLD
jgi:hypothetical protein